MSHRPESLLQQSISTIRPWNLASLIVTCLLLSTAGGWLLGDPGGQEGDWVAAASQRAKELRENTFYMEAERNLAENKENEFFTEVGQMLIDLRHQFEQVEHHQVLLVNPETSSEMMDQAKPKYTALVSALQETAGQLHEKLGSTVTGMERVKELPFVDKGVNEMGFIRQNIETASAQFFRNPGQITQAKEEETILVCLYWVQEMAGRIR